MALQHHYGDNNPHIPGEPSQLLIDISPELGRRIGMAAALNNLSVYEYVGRILDQTVPSESSLIRRKRGHGLNQEAVEDLLRTSDEIMSKHPDVVYEDSVEILRQIREERMRELEQ